jgi:hypothetical protein
MVNGFESPWTRTKMADDDCVGEDRFLEHYRRQLLTKHIDVGSHKAISYLPIKTIEGMLGLSIDEYRGLIEGAGNKCVIFAGSETCIESGAVFAYSVRDLDAILRDHAALLTSHAWPVSSGEFIARIAKEWLQKDHPIMPVVGEAFGDVALGE